MSTATGLVQLFDLHPEPIDQHQELLTGLRCRPRRIAPKFFYDQQGSRLFDAITLQPEYYPTRTERDILRRAAMDIGDCVGRDCVLIEPGSGSCEKVELLLAALAPRAYIPMDISADHLAAAAQRLAQRWPELPIYAITADYNRTLKLPPDLPSGRRLAFFPGSTLGNFEPVQAQHFLSRLRRLVGAGGGLLIGVDQDKDPALLNAAYNDAAGLTAAFNLNVLIHANRILDADFDPHRFQHRAFFNREQGRVEMHLSSRYRQRITAGDSMLEFSAGETIHTENSYKYPRQRFLQLAHAAGFTPRHCWTDDNDWFAVHYLEAH